MDLKDVPLKEETRSALLSAIISFRQHLKLKLSVDSIFSTLTGNYVYCTVEELEPVSSGQESSVDALIRSTASAFELLALEGYITLVSAIPRSAEPTPEHRLIETSRSPDHLLLLRMKAPRALFRAYDDGEVELVHCEEDGFAPAELLPLFKAAAVAVEQLAPMAGRQG